VGKDRPSGPTGSALRLKVEQLAVPVSLAWIVGVTLAAAAVGSSVSLIALVALAPIIAALRGSPRASLFVGAAALVDALLIELLQGQPLNSQNFVRLVYVVLSIGLAQWIAVLRAQLTDALALAAERADYDSLTRVLSRRELLARAEVLFELRQGERPALSVFMIDVDRFKMVNDTHGHLVGDQVLAAVATRFESVLRSGDLLGRFGGDEFIGILVGGRPEQVEQVTERLWQVVAAEPVPSEAGPLAVTVSVGMTMMEWADESLDSAIRRADAALYQAKTEGRDRYRVG
jgi:diguanylate cyclase (GGDEF)-like protein